MKYLLALAILIVCLFPFLQAEGKEHTLAKTNLTLAGICVTGERTAGEVGGVRCPVQLGSLSADEAKVASACPPAKQLY